MRQAVKQQAASGSRMRASAARLAESSAGIAVRDWDTFIAAPDDLVASATSQNLVPEEVIPVFATGELNQTLRSTATTLPITVAWLPSMGE